MDTERQLQYERKKTRYAWAKYYEAVNRDRTDNYNVIKIVTRYELDQMPSHIKNEFKEMADTLKKKWECPICLNTIEPNDLDITNCGHFYCKGCLKSLKNSMPDSATYNCAVCRKTVVKNSNGTYSTLEVRHS